MTPKPKSETPLQVKLEGDEIVIRVGISVLKCAAENCPTVTDEPGELAPPYIKIDDARRFAEEVVQGLLHEEEDGSTVISDCFDEAIKIAVDDGSLAVDYDFKPTRIQ